MSKGRASEASEESRVTLKIAGYLHLEVSRLSSEFEFSIGDFTDLLLEYATKEMARVEQALDERKEKGAQKARKRRREPR